MHAAELGFGLNIETKRILCMLGVADYLCTQSALEAVYVTFHFFD
jgi:hypothetical protein